MPLLGTRGAASARGFGFGVLVIPKIAPGQQAYTSPGTYTWVAPAGVTSVSVVAVGGGATGMGQGGVAPLNGDNSSFNATVIAYGGQGQTGGTNSGCDGGGAGGNGGNASGARSGGGGGAGGYSNSGGVGGNASAGGGNGGSGAGGGAGGGFGQSSSVREGSGGGVGILGAGSNGAGGTAASRLGKGGSGGGDPQPFNDGGLYGGGGAGNESSGVGGIGGAGGGLGYKNNIVVSPGASYTVVVGVGAKGGGGWPSGDGAVRIIWAGTRPGDVSRSFPSTNTGDL